MPDRFKVIVVNENGDVVVSNLIEKKAFQSTVYFDYASGEAEEEGNSISYLRQFVTTFKPTIIIELIVLMMFGFAVKKNLLPFLTINGISQLMLTGVIIFVTFTSGTLAAMFIYVLFEVVIVIMETVAYVVLLKEHTKVRRAMYSVVANTVSFGVGIYILIQNF